jgi:hypothetical protein
LFWFHLLFVWFPLTCLSSLIVILRSVNYEQVRIWFCVSDIKTSVFTMPREVGTLVRVDYRDETISVETVITKQVNDVKL